jgi:GNAT superfamily N-acetyltransferase
MHDAGDTPTDILVKLYALPPPDLSRTSAAGVDVRRARAWERHRVVGWVADRFEPGWASEVEVAYGRQPIACFVAQRADALLGFACYDSSALGFFGPLGVAEEARGGGVGAALLLSCLHAMHEQGYGYAVIGAAGPVDFYLRLVDGLPIPGSWPGIYGGRSTAGQPG